MGSRVVVLVPWRAGEARREHNWAIARPRLEALGFPLYTGDCRGKWNRGAAVNGASQRAGRWDVALIADADTIPEPEAVHRAIAHVRRTGGGARPHDELWRLTPLGSKLIAHLGPGAVDVSRRAHTTGTYRGGGLLVVARAGWDAIGGFVAYDAWGYEDSATNIRLLVHADWDRLPGRAYHLWHKAEPKDDPDTVANREKLRRLEREHQAVIREARRSKRWPAYAIL